MQKTAGKFAWNTRWRREASSLATRLRGERGELELKERDIPQLTAKIAGIFTGKARHRWEGKPQSAISKLRTQDRLRVGECGLEGDEQADLSVHGGPGKAIHHYPVDHYEVWADEIGGNSLFAPGGFGENISTSGMTEADVCIGDIFNLGSAVVQISQGRQPCWKLAAHTGVKRLPFLVQKTLRTGWYYRVLEAGYLVQDDRLELTARPHPEWTVEAVTRCRFDGRIETHLALALSELPALAPGWRDAFVNRARKRTENTDKRLKG